MWLRAHRHHSFDRFQLGFPSARCYVTALRVVSFKNLRSRRLAFCVGVVLLRVIASTLCTARLSRQHTRALAPNRSAYAPRAVIGSSSIFVFAASCSRENRRHLPSGSCLQRLLVQFPRHLCLVGHQYASSLTIHVPIREQLANGGN